ncbi:MULTISPECIES: DJ-1 family glyoxalase III [Caproicibacterium]|uniref:DJ-1/PfpI family protein n=1 Tax=Caproicibacterium argilliputei TaxID=3030016 RepID=A0AA97DCR5_9FIRM|nr:DJ-1 family glyoxalase III [Caproicibacterium argilliputei]WOC33085.1 DJ-1/PfpI family protein [Caproicibacterium argilliputei]
MVYVFLANGFEEIEALAPVDLLRRAGLEVLTVGIGDNEITGAHGIDVTPDIAEWDLNFDVQPADLVVLPGGMPGTKNLEASASVRNAVQWCVEQNRYIGAICAAPSVLGHWGVLKGHEAVCYPGYESELGCTLGKKPVVQSGKIITARGAGVAVEFGLALISALCGAQKSEEIRKSIQCR